MSSGNDILSVVFLALVCLVIAGIVNGLGIRGSGLIIPSFVFMAIGLWIAYDYIMASRYKAKEQCMQNKMDMMEMDTIARLSEDNHQKLVTDCVAPNKPVTKHIAQPKKEHHDEFDIDIYNGKTSIKDMHRSMGCTGDTMLCNRMKYMGVQAQISQDIRAKWNKYSFQPYLEEELQEHSDRKWWTSDHLEDEF